MSHTADLHELVAPTGSAILLPSRAQITQWTHEDFLPLLWNEVSPYPIDGPLTDSGIETDSGKFPGGIQLWFQSPKDSSAINRSGIDTELPGNSPSWAEVGRQNFGDAAQVTYELDCVERPWPNFAHKFVAHYDVHLSEALTLTLSIRNEDESPFLLENFIEIYCAVGDVKDVTSQGFDQSICIDLERNNRISKQLGELSFISQTDLIFESDSDFILDDPRRRQKVIFSKNGSASTSFWNPWAEGMAHLSDSNRNEWQHFVKVGIGNVGREAVLLHPQESHVLSLSLEIETME